MIKKLRYIITELFPEMNISEYLNFDWGESYSGKDIIKGECPLQENQQRPMLVLYSLDEDKIF